MSRLLLVSNLVTDVIEAQGTKTRIDDAVTGMAGVRVARWLTFGILE
jgi:hypothetical protein